MKLTTSLRWNEELNPRPYFPIFVGSARFPLLPMLQMDVRSSSEKVAELYLPKGRTTDTSREGGRVSKGKGQ